MSLTLQLKKGTAAENASYTGPLGELTADIETYRLFVHDGETEGGRSVCKTTTSGNGDGEFAIYIVSPDSESETTQQPIFKATPHLGEYVHELTRWLITTDHDFNTMIVDTGWGTEYSNTLDLSVEGPVLSDRVTHFVKVQYRDNQGEETPFSNILTFTPLAPRPEKPTITSPITNTEVDTDSPIFVASPYVGEVAHGKSRWLIATDATLTTLVYDSGWSDVHLESLDLETENVELDLDVTLHIGVTYRTIDGFDSEPSLVTKFIVPPVVYRTGIEIGNFEGNTNNVEAICVGADGSVYSGVYQKIHKIDPVTMTEVGLFEGHTSTVHSIHQGSDGYLYTGSADRSVRKIDPVTMTEMGIFEGHTSTVYSVCLGSDGYVYSTSNDDTLRKIDSATMTEVGSFSDHVNRVYSVCAGSDGFIYTGEWKTIHKIDPTTMSEVDVFTGHTHYVMCLYFGSDGFLYSGSNDDTLRKIDPTTMTEMGVFENHTSNILCLSEGLDNCLYSGSDDATVRRIRMLTFTEVGIFEGHTQGINGLMCGTDGYVYTGSDDDTVKKIEF